MNNNIFIGIDCGSTSNTAALNDSDGKQICNPFDFSNDLIGAEHFTAQVFSAFIGKEDTMGASGIPKPFFHIGIEATSVYSWHFIFYIKYHPFLPQSNIRLYALNPKIVRHFKKCYTESSKTDIICAKAIAERLRFGNLPTSCIIDTTFFSLQRLTRYRLHLIRLISHEKTFFLNNLFLKFSNYSTQSPFADVFGATSVSILSNFLSPEEIANTDLDILADFITKHSKNSFDAPKDIAQKLISLANSSYKLPKTHLDSINSILAFGLQNINTLKDNLKKVDAAISNEICNFPNQLASLSSISGIGKVLSAGILAEIGNINKFNNQAKLAKFAGLTWRIFQSGNFKSPISRLTKEGSQYLRYYLVEAANSIIKFNAVFKNYYDKKYAEVPKYKHKRALVLTARKLVRLIFCLLKNNKLYVLPAVS